MLSRADSSRIITKNISKGVIIQMLKATNDLPKVLRFDPRFVFNMKKKEI